MRACRTADQDAEVIPAPNRARSAPIAARVRPRVANRTARPASPAQPSAMAAPPSSCPVSDRVSGTIEFVACTVAHCRPAAEMTSAAPAAHSAAAVRSSRRRRLFGSFTDHSVQYVGVPAGAVAGVAGRTHLVDLDQQGVAVAVERDGLDPLLVAGGVPLHPVLLAAARPVGAPPGGQGAVQGLVVHLSHHEHFACVVLLGDGGNEAVGGALQARCDLGVQVGRAYGHGVHSAGSAGCCDTGTPRRPRTTGSGAGPSQTTEELQGADLVGLRTPVTLRHLELDALILVEAAVPGGLNRRVVHEHVRSTTVNGDEAEALFGVEPLHRALLRPVFLLATTLGLAPRVPGPVA